MSTRIPTDVGARSQRRRGISARSSAGGRYRAGQFALYLVLSAWAIISLVPILYAVLTSFKSSPQIYANPYDVPHPFLWDNYATAWTQGNLGRYFVNGIIVGTISAALTLAVAAPAAYAFARFHFRARRLMHVFLAALIVPQQVVLIPLFILFRTVHLLDTWFALFLVYAAFGFPFTAYYLHSFFKGLPRELEDAASIDGCTPFQTFYKVMLPLGQPALVTMAILGFLNVWNDLIFVLVLIQSNDLRTVPAGLTYFQGQWSSQTGVILAGAVLSMTPIALLYLALNRKITEGLTAGAIKA